MEHSEAVAALGEVALEPAREAFGMETARARPDAERAWVMQAVGVIERLGGVPDTDLASHLEHALSAYDWDGAKVLGWIDKLRRAVEEAVRDQREWEFTCPGCGAVVLSTIGEHRLSGLPSLQCPECSGCVDARYYAPAAFEEEGGG